MMPGGTVRPSVTLPLAYVSAAALAFVLAAAAVPWLAPELAGHYYQPRILALTHTVTLGWITLTIMGASYQLIPIVLARPLWSERLAWWQLGLMVVGIIGMIGHFFLGAWSGLVWAAALVAAGVGAHLVNVARTMRGLAHWTFTARMVALALAGLGVTTLVGFGLGLDKVLRVLPAEDLFPHLHAHVHLALLGWVLPMTIGVAARVYPMFLLAAEPAGWPGRAQLWGLAAGVPAIVVGICASPVLLAAGTLAVTVAVAGHLVWLAAMVRSRKRPALDWGLRFVLTGAGTLALATALGLGLALDLTGGPRVALAYAALALGAWLSLTIAGMLLKIVPFLVWYRVYAPRAGRAAVPTLAGLSSPRAEGLAWLLLTLGTTSLPAALWYGDPAWIRAAGLMVAAGAVVFGATLARVLGHFRRRATSVSRATAPVVRPA
jgi:hypothetical protein